MARRIEPLATVALVAALSTSCLKHRPPEESPPPPRGQSIDQYLADKDEQPVAQADDSEEMRLHVIDVGQGTAALLEFPCGAVLVDTGGEYNAQFDSVEHLTAYLDAFFARRSDLRNTLALLAISHPHIDHTRGLAAVLDRYTIENIIDNGDVREDLGGKPQLFMHEWLAKNPKVGHLDIARSDIDPQEGLASPVIDPIGKCRGSQVDPIIRVLWSGDFGREEKGHNANNDSVVLRVDFGEASFLLPGDLELLALAQIVKKYDAHPDILDTDVYLFPHHGSRNSSTQEIIKRVSPEIVVISQGPYERKLGTFPEYTARSFGHPHRDAMGHLSDPEHGVTGKREPIEAWVGVRGAWKETPSEFEQQTVDRAIYTTGWDGDVVVVGMASGQFRVETSKKRPSTSAAADSPN